MNYIDLGLRSGILWADTNEDGLFSFDEAKERFGDSVPTNDEWKELIDNCEWLWDFCNKQMMVIGKNGNKITLPAVGYCSGTSFFNMDSLGYYWSSSLLTGYLDYAYFVYFDSIGVQWDYANSCYGQSIRLVKRK